MLIGILASCKGFHDAELVEVNELLPVSQDIVYVDAIGGEASLSFYATGKVRTQVLTDLGDWAEVTSPGEFDGDGAVSVSFDRNRSYRRMVAVRLELEDKGLEDTLYFRQNGIEPELSCDTPYSIVDGSKDNTVGITINTNINREDLNIDVNYLDNAQDWIMGLAFSGDIAWDTDDFAFKTRASTIERSSRASVRIWFEDSWGEDVSVFIYLTRTSMNGDVGTLVALNSLRTRTEPFSADEFMEGYVISDCRSLNMAENPNTAHDVLDRSVSAKTVYVSSEDGSTGVRVILDKASDNVFKPGMKVAFSLDGVSLEKKTAPECYTLKGVRTDNLLKVENGYPVAPKVKTISQLGAEDIHTLVTLTDVEFVNKEGSYTNIREGYDFFDGWASLLVDAEGESIFAPVNLDCNWRRTGAGVPQGSGTVTGIIVSEDLVRLGNPGDYQIRVVDDSGFNMTDEPNLKDFVVWKGNPGEKHKITDVIGADVGTATLRTEIAESDISTVSADQAIRAVADFSGTTRANNGMLNSTALGYQVKLDGWYHFDENGSVDSTKGLLMNFSTKGQNGKMVAYISFLAWGVNGSYRVAPAHWTFQYSTDGETYTTLAPSVRTDNVSDFVHLRPGPSGEDYHNGRKYFPSSYMAQGFCDVVYLLPSDVMDKDDVWIRFAPSTDGVLFDFPAEASAFADDIEGNVVMEASQYNGDIHFAEISFMTI